MVALSISQLQSCKPRIYSFTANPRTIGPNDSIQVNWKTRGMATLLIHDRPMPGPDTTSRLRELTLVVQKNGHEISKMIQVAVLPNGITDKIVFKTVLHGDTLIAAGVNNPLRWGDAFDIRTVQEGSGRSLTVLHAGHILHLEPSSEPNKALLGTPVKGNWEFRSLLTPAEKADHRLAPDRLSILITVQHH
ncbi:hypothetical protein GO755_35915 [Spirosoma sp. HMF4905]|uniref:Uncharacterized protein n=1 Tax=Spirosoma arboris TaxID=2682092 RepID=A0A7K1SNS7_9BACT|nr:hypothetical protein [Spirosoma arboris]MVM35464.1 hypothetical protein [Spirosoma arboris]